MKIDRLGFRTVRVRKIPEVVNDGPDTVGPFLHVLDEQIEIVQHDFRFFIRGCKDFFYVIDRFLERLDIRVEKGDGIVEFVGKPRQEIPEGRPFLRLKELDLTLAEPGDQNPDQKRHGKKKGQGSRQVRGDGDPAEKKRDSGRERNDETNLADQEISSDDAIKLKNLSP